MAPPGAESKILRHLLEEDLYEKVDYESDTDFVVLPLLVKATYVVSQTHYQNVVRLC